MSVLRLQAYGRILKGLLLPYGVIRWAMGIFFIIYLSAVLGAWIHKGYFDPAVPVLMTFVAMYLLLIGVFSPIYVLTICSSKPFQYLSNFRLFFLSFYILYALVLTLLVSLINIQTNNWQLEIKFILAVWVMVSGLTIAQFILTWRVPQLLGVIFFTFACLKLLLTTLMQFSFIELLLIGLLSWSAFSYWWLRWKPKKFFINFIAVGMDKMMSGGAYCGAQSIPFSILYSKSKPRSLYGTLLCGMSDNSGTVFRTGLFISLITLLMLLMFKILLNNKLQDFVMNYWPFLIAFMFVTSSSGMLQSICRHVRRTWLLSVGSRRDHLRSIERYWYRYNFLLFSMTPVVGLFSAYMVGFIYLSLLNFILLIALSGVLISMSLYATLWVFARDNDSNISLWTQQTLLILIQMIILGGLSILINYQSYLILSLSFVGLFLISVLLRRQLFKSWDRVNFTRAIY